VDAPKKSAGKAAGPPRGRLYGCLLPGGAALLIAFLCLWFFSFLLQGILPFLLAGREIEAERLPVESVGLTELHLGESVLFLERDEIRWSDLRLGYSPLSLLKGRFSYLEVSSPEWTVSLRPRPEEAPLPVSPAVPGSSLPMEEEKPPPPPEKGPVPAPDLAGEAGSADPAPLPPRREVPTSLRLPVDLSSTLQRLPLRTMEAADGTLRLALSQAESVAFSAGALVQRRSFSSEAFLHLAGHGLEAALYLKQLEPEDAFSLQADAHARLATALPVVRESAGLSVPAWIDFEDAELQLFALGDFDGQEVLRTSLDGEVNGLVVAHQESGLRIPVPQMVVAGRWEKGEASLEAGLRTDSMHRGALSVDPFALKISSEKGISDWGINSEAIRFRAGALEGQFALHGLVERVWTLPRFQVEVRCGRLHGGAFDVGPFAVEISGGPEEVSLRCPSITLEREGTLWIEDLSGRAYPRADLRAKLFGLAGTELLGMGMEQLGSGDWRFTWKDPTGKRGGATLRAGAHRLPEFLDLKGEVPVPVLHNLGRWAGYLPGHLEGGALQVETHLQRTGPGFLRGTVELDFRDLGFRGDADWEARGFSGQLALAVIGLPRSEGRQEWNLRELRYGEFRLEDIRLHWEMPHFREIRVERLSGRLEGAEVALAPFAFDPLSPQIATTATLRAFPGQRILALLEEERFGLDGELSGTLQIRGNSEGIEIGAARFVLGQEGRKAARFRFEEEAFLREHLGELAGIPETMRKRIQAALLENGIRVDSLEILLEEAPAAGKVRLRLEMRGECHSPELRIPIERFVINNMISRRDLARLFLPGGFVSVQP
jgi:hypothetical protein